jgi:hypothetical protein
MTPVSDWETPVMISDPIIISDRLSFTESAAATPRHFMDVAQEVHKEEGPHATNVTHAAVHPQTDIHSPKLKPEFPSPKPESSGIRRTTLSIRARGPGCPALCSQRDSVLPRITHPFATKQELPSAACECRTKDLSQARTSLFQHQ